jgi:hypothetical protein
VLELAARLAAQRREAAGDDHGEPVGARVDDARLAQHAQLLGPALDGLLAGLERRLEHLGEQLVLLLGGVIGAEPMRGPCARGREPPRLGHRADRGLHRALGRVAHRCIRTRRPRARRPPTRAPGRPARPAATRDSSAAPSHDLRQDHAAVPRAPSRAALAKALTISSRPTVSIAESSSSPQLIDRPRVMVQRHVVAVSPSATGKTFSR